MKAKELKDKSKQELEKTLRELQAKLVALRFDKSAQQLRNVKEISSVKKDVARILTVLNQSK